jgi:hypothetical protein
VKISEVVLLLFCGILLVNGHSTLAKKFSFSIRQNSRLSMATPVSQAMISAISLRLMTKSEKAQTSFEHGGSAVCLPFYWAILRRSLLCFRLAIFS